MEHMLYWERQTLKWKVAECRETPSAKKPWTEWGWPQIVEVSGLGKQVDKGSFHCDGEHGKNRFGKRLSLTRDTNLEEMSHKQARPQE